MGELVRAQPRVHAPVREVWRHLGVACVITASPMGGWNGYAQLPPGSRWRRAGWLDLPLDGFALTYGPDDDGWVGFDTGHAWDYWAADDDQPGYVPDSWRQLGASTMPPEVEAAALVNLRQQLRQLAGSMPGHQVWTLPRLRRHVERLAEALAVLR